MQKSNVKNLAQFKDEHYGKRGIKKREKLEAAYEPFKMGALIHETRLIFIILFISWNAVTAQKIKVKELGYGECSHKILYTELLPDSSTIKHHTGGYKLNIIKKTDNIVAHIGTQFGAEYIIKSPADEYMNVTTVWKYPAGVKDLSGKDIIQIKYEVLKPTNEYTYSSYTIDNENELAKGKWTLEIYVDTLQIYQRVFYLK